MMDEKNGGVREYEMEIDRVWTPGGELKRGKLV